MVRSNNACSILKIEVLLIPKPWISLIVLFDAPSNKAFLMPKKYVQAKPWINDYLKNPAHNLAQNPTAGIICRLIYKNDLMSFPAKWLQSHIWPFERTSLSLERPSASAQDTGAHFYHFWQFCPGYDPTASKSNFWLAHCHNSVNALRFSFGLLNTRRKLLGIWLHHRVCSLWALDPLFLWLQNNTSISKSFTSSKQVAVTLPPDSWHNPLSSKSRRRGLQEKEK